MRLERVLLVGNKKTTDSVLEPPLFQKLLRILLFRPQGVHSAVGCVRENKKLFIYIINLHNNIGDFEELMNLYN